MAADDILTDGGPVRGSEAPLTNDELVAVRKLLNVLAPPTGEVSFEGSMMPLVDTVTAIAAGQKDKEDTQPSLGPFDSILEAQTLYLKNGPGTNSALVACVHIVGILRLVTPCAALLFRLDNELDSLDWEGFFGEMVRMANAYEIEDERVGELTVAEMLWLIGHSIRAKLMTEEAFKILGPSGDKDASVGHLLAEIKGDALRLAMYLGCRRAPTIPLGSGGGGAEDAILIPGK